MRRRDFISTGAASVTAATMVASAQKTMALPISASTGVDGAKFRSWLGNEFRVSSGGSLRTVAATLMAIDDGPVHRGLEQFSVVFGGPVSLPTGLCWLSHADGAHFLLHLHGQPHSALRRAHFSLLETNNV